MHGRLIITLTMATPAKARFTLQDYIGHSFHPDCDFIDGLLEERNRGELEHSEMQIAILAWFQKHAKEWSIKALPEMRVQTNATRYRVADVAIVAPQAPRESILKTPPPVVIEILSPEDRRPLYNKRPEEHRNMGIENIWVVDPMTRQGFDCSDGGWKPAPCFTVKDSPNHLSLAELDFPATGK